MEFFLSLARFISKLLLAFLHSFFILFLILLYSFSSPVFFQLVAWFSFLRCISILRGQGCCFLAMVLLFCMCFLRDLRYRFYTCFVIDIEGVLVTIFNFLDLEHLFPVDIFQIISDALLITFFEVKIGARELDNLFFRTREIPSDNSMRLS